MSDRTADPVRALVLAKAQRDLLADTLREVLDALAHHYDGSDPGTNDIARKAERVLEMSGDHD